MRKRYKPPVRYELRALVALLAVIACATIGFAGLRVAMTPPARAFPIADATDTFVVRNAAQIRPSAAAYAAFAASDAEWRRRAVAAYRPTDDPRTVRFTSGGEWHPSARQAVDDQVYRLMKTGHLDEAIRTLTAWVTRHPDDREELLKLARLLNEAGRPDEAIPRYRQVLALETGRSP
jgi:Flp pilus assembly protein TadD